MNTATATATQTWQGITLNSKSSNSSMQATVDSQEIKRDGRGKSSAESWENDAFLKPAKYANQVREVTKKIEGAQEAGGDDGEGRRE
ncbi:hypothetical protein T440DRAFT_460055 [Plenodomus tracheiphilus IPT5]|uniref:Uncharacterized protein n=1 Tax=Plenodomus tracheiphilus IPT5 TaxID=1408161 RepID=A0A6A7ATE1_9PLEO|nr:hypothetical protein T440DRAFT_460055 [Plenodomus tracheiphilus IPT5]